MFCGWFSVGMLVVCVLWRVVCYYLLCGGWGFLYGCVLAPMCGTVLFGGVGFFFVVAAFAWVWLFLSCFP